MFPKPLRVAVAGCLLAASSLAQLPGETPRLRLSDGLGTTVPAGPGPFNSSGVFDAPAGSAFSAQLTYLAAVPPNDAVPWGLLVSAQQTPFPVTAFPPPLFTMPPFLFVGPSPAMLSAAGQGSHAFAVPPGLYEGSVHLQAIVLDGSALPGPALKLSNGVRVDIVPPPFHVAFSFAREAPALSASTHIDGVGRRDYDGDTLTNFPPFGAVDPPTAEVDGDSGLPDLVEFLPIAPTAPDAPINPRARPVTRLSQSLTDSAADNVFFVDDTSFFPNEGSLIVSFQQILPWGAKTNGNTRPPKAEVVTYRGRTPTSFLNVTRKRLGSQGNATYPHIAGEFVVGDFTSATTSGALARSRVSLDVTNPRLPHVVIPAFASPIEGGGSVLVDLDLYRYRDVSTGVEGFAVLDRASHAWRVLGGTQVDASTNQRRWDPLVAVSPDGTFFLASEQVSIESGPLFPSSPDRLWAVRLDGQEWPASGSEAWEITYQLTPDPTGAESNVRSRAVHMRSVAIIGSGPHDWVAYVGLGHKFAQSSLGLNSAAEGGVPVAYEAAYVRENLLVRDYIEVPLVSPGSGDASPSMPRPWITSAFPTLGVGTAVLRFDPEPAVAPDASQMLLSAGQDELLEDVFVVRSVSVAADGSATRLIQNLSGHGAGLAGTAPGGNVRPFEPGGHGLGSKASFSPAGNRVAFVAQDKGLDNRDWIHIVRTNGASFAQIVPVYATTTGTFREAGPLVNDRQICALHWLDDDRLVFLMGRGHYAEPFGFFDAAKQPSMDLFVYRLSTDTMVNLTKTGGAGSGFAALGKLWPAGSFRSENGRYVYFLRDGTISAGVTTLPVETQVFNVLGVDGVTQTAFDVTGDELSLNAALPNLDLPAGEAFTPVEPAAALRWVEGWGVQAGSFWLLAHEAADGTPADEVFRFDGNAPFAGIQLTSGSAAGSHKSNLVPDPAGARAAFAATAGSNAFGLDQHPFVVDFGSFVFVRDLTPQLSLAGVPFGRLMDGSFHFIAPSGGAPAALVFSMGVDVDPDNGVARDTLPAYLGLSNVTNTFLEPVPLVIPLLHNAGLGSDFRFYITSAGPSSAP